MADHWEYRVLDVKPGGLTQDALNTYGRDGWELTVAQPGTDLTRLVFKRASGARKERGRG